MSDSFYLDKDVRLRFEKLWTRSDVKRYLTVLGSRMDSLIEHITQYERDEFDLLTFDENEYRANIRMEAFSLTEMLAQFCAGGVSWILTDKTRFMSPTVDLVNVLESRRPDLTRSSEWYKYRIEVSVGSYDFLSAAEHTKTWFEALKIEPEGLQYLLWSAEKALRLLDAKERVAGFTPLVMTSPEVFEEFTKCESPIESILFMQLVVDGLLPPLLQAQMEDDPYRLDFAIPEGRIVIECDGEKYHDMESDSIRDKELRERGWIVLRFTSKQILEDPAYCSFKVRSEYPW